MKRFSRAHVLWAWVALLGLAAFGCRTTDLIIARRNATPPPARTITRTPPRPTFTPAPAALPNDPAYPPPLVAQNPQPPLQPAPNVPPVPVVVPTHVPTPRPIVPTRAPTPRPVAPIAPPPPPPTTDPYAGYYYKPSKMVCVTAGNTRIEGIVTENGLPKNGVTVRVSDREGGAPSINDFVTGTDPSDYKHTDPALAGKYRMGIYEGQQNAGNWWVFLIDGAGNLLSPGVLVTTQDGGGCNTATVNFSH